MYVGIGGYGMFYSYDGIHWNMSASGSNLIHSNATTQKARVIWNGRIWVVCGDGASYTILYSLDGIHWTGVANSRTIFDVSGGAMDIAWNGRVFVATGVCANGYAVSTSSDGINWTTATEL
jgi:hypothetical protein